MELTFKSAQKVIDEAGKNIPQELEKVSLKLMQLVSSGELLGFGFTSTKSSSGKTETMAYSKENVMMAVDVEPRLILRLKLKGNEYISLGRTNINNTEYTHKTGFGRATITDDSKDTINEISEYVEFVNKKLSNYLPEIDIDTDYSAKVLRKNSLVEFKQMFPKFLEHLTPEVEVKKKYKKPMK